MIVFSSAQAEGYSDKGEPGIRNLDALPITVHDGMAASEGNLTVILSNLYGFVIVQQRFSCTKALCAQTHTTLTVNSRLLVRGPRISSDPYVCVRARAFRLRITGRRVARKNGV
jgi:hypothetical protein